MTSKEKELLELIKLSERLNIFDIPARFQEELLNLLNRNVLKKKLYCYDLEYKEHLSTYYISAS